jgi:glucose-1-phosphate thymidylyltransferase
MPPAKGNPTPRVASDYLLENFRTARITRAYVILRDGKWDIPAYFGDGRSVGLHIAYVVTTGSIGPPDTVDRAYAFVADKVVAFGFPDILFGPCDVYSRLLERMRQTDAEVVLGLYSAHETRQMDMVDVDASGRVQSLILKPASTHLQYTWICAVWTPVFTQFMHAFVQSERARQARDPQAYADIDSQGDLPFGAVILAGVQKGLRVYGLTFPGETYIDIGTPSSLLAAVKKFSI